VHNIFASTCIYSTITTSTTTTTIPHSPPPTIYTAGNYFLKMGHNKTNSTTTHAPTVHITQSEDRIFKGRRRSKGDKFQSNSASRENHRRGDKEDHDDRDRNRDKQIRMLGCWLFGSLLRM